MGWSRLLFFINLFSFGVILDFQKSCRDSEESCHTHFTQFSLLLAMVTLSKLKKKLTSVQIVHETRPCLDRTDFPTSILFNVPRSTPEYHIALSHIVP